MICNKTIYFIVRPFAKPLQHPGAINGKQTKKMEKKFLIVDDYDDLRTALAEEFGKNGNIIETTNNRDDGLRLMENDGFDVIITDLDGDELIVETEVVDEEISTCFPEEIEPEEKRSHIKAFKICIPNFKNGKFTDKEVTECVETILRYKSRYIDRHNAVQERHEKIEFEIPSVIDLMHSVLEYLLKRVEKLGIVNPEQSNLFVALDEAFVNAVKHGNKFDATKNIRIVADVTPKEARFTIEDEGEGFDVTAIPDPTDTENLFKSSGRGVMFMYNIMDEVVYNEKGNRITMVKKRNQE
jgi:serine/threonine-protein kinase RsbW